MIRPTIVLAALALATPVLADPCTARVTGYKPGSVITGSVRYIGDGDGLCVGNTPDPATWTEIRIADFRSPELHEPGGKEAKRALERLALGKQVICTATLDRRARSTRSFDRLIAVCRIEGVSVGNWMRAAGVKEGGR